MDTNTYLIDDVKIDIDKFYIEIELFRLGDEDDPLKFYEIDIHIGGKLWCVGKTKDVGELEKNARQKFNKFVSIAKEIQKAFE